MDRLSNGTTNIKLIEYHKELSILLNLINKEIKQINKKFFIFKNHSDKDVPNYFLSLKSRFENLKNIVINAKNINFISELSFEKLDCLLGVIELKLSELEVTKIDLAFEEELMNLYKHICPIYEQKKLLCDK
ncbi:hypothetical protein [Tissierella praeacuta]|jgi:hypothetical protein|uniref:hypothetical protein n=1 Tax=Tissierella praeacuta TaxID=43131 RepID=UPI0028A8346C|nr:hypothetical protein [Tissierella praeacuta]